MTEPDALVPFPAQPHPDEGEPRAGFGWFSLYLPPGV